MLTYLFSYTYQGVLISALKKGEWILLDEINLASAEMLECLSGLLDSAAGSLVLTERGFVVINLNLSSLNQYEILDMLTYFM